VVHKIKERLKIDIGETTEDKKFSIEGVRCLGACGLAPVMMIDQDTYGALTPSKALTIISQYGGPDAGQAPEEEAEAIAEQEG